MPGQPFYHVVERRLAELGGLDWLLGEIENGRSLLRIAREDVRCSRQYLSKWLRADPERETRYAEAKRWGAAAKFEESEDPLDELQAARDSGELVLPTDVQLAQARARHKAAMAGILDRELSDRPQAAQVNLNLNVGELHLAAIRERAEPKQIPARVVDAEVEP